jgi:hypothetical protein
MLLDLPKRMNSAHMHLWNTCPNVWSMSTSQRPSRSGFSTPIVHLYTAMLYMLSNLTSVSYVQFLLPIINNDHWTLYIV